MTFIKSLSFLILFVSLNAFCQKTVLTFENDEVSKRLTKESYTFSNTENNDLAILLIEDKKAFAYLFDKDFNQKSKLETKGLKNKYNEVVGYAVDNLNYRVLYANDKKDKFAVLNIDFGLGSMDISEFKMDFDGEIYLSTVNYNNQIFLFTAEDNLELSIWTFNNLSFNKAKTFTLDDLKDKSLLKKNYGVHVAFSNNIGKPFWLGTKVSGISKIDQRIPNAIEVTSSLGKLYQTKNKVYLTLENEEDKTYFYDIDIENYEIDLKIFDYPEGTIEPFKKFNSYIYEDKIYQIASSKQEMKLLINTLSGELVKSFYIDKEHPITFKNSPIIQEGVATPFISTRELEETQKYLRKISSGNLGITVIKTKNNYHTSMGGYKITKNPTPIPSNSSDPFNPFSTPTGTFVSYNPTYSAYNTYTKTKSTYFHSIFDLEFNHLKGEVEENIFDKIDALKKVKKYSTADYVFFHDNTLYYGYFDLKEGNYNLITF
ncbi:hypothetical protein [Mangrovimonas sp. YM274]|uniref:hypothetical protein n=1 Tax=Mangrovimonas sp. YM274 TaxID=3070660 RepID=UPI0027DCCC2A|nr:hypothetical protein [Mangrovimonas sp. YM274]WMI69209.1 hypothetical protein RBH95_02270 [Mangrovimonas sp. YM274]